MSITTLCCLVYYLLCEFVLVGFLPMSKAIIIRDKEVFYLLSALVVEEPNIFFNFLSIKTYL
jgi:hypothetical protein